MRILAFCGLSIGLLQPASCQILESARSTLDSSGALVYEATFVFRSERPATPPLTGAPYSAEEVFEGQQILGDGTRVVQSQSRGKVLRDSQGRMRWERPLILGPDIADRPLIVEISDGVAGYQFTLDPGTRVAHRSKLPQPGAKPLHAPAMPTVSARIATAAAPAAAPAQAPANVEEIAAPEVATATLPRTEGETGGPHVERLGIRLIDGVPAEGTRVTNTIPGAKPEDRPTITTSETWMSTELHVVILSKFVDPVNGESTIRLKNLRRSEPDPVLFQAPQNYVIQDEVGEFRIGFVVRK